MAWYAFHGANSYVANVPTLADARSEAHDTQTTETGPYSTQAAAQAALGSKRPAPPSGGSGQPWWVFITGNTRGGTYATVQAASKPANDAAGPFATQAAAQAWITAQSAIHLPTIHLPNPFTGINAVGAFFNKLGDRATIVRIVKVVIGAVMIIAGLAKMGAPAAEKIAAKLPKVIPV